SQSSNQLLSIITDIISIATIEAGQLKLNASRMEVNSIIHILYEQYKGLAENKNIELNYVITLSDKDATIFNDGTKFLEILSNLINNAIKFTPKGSVTFGYELTGDMIRFFVKDTGIGIRKEHHESIFDRFWQVENSLTNKFGGTGLGLSISKTYVELMGGKIWLTSEPDLGTTFFFTLPYKKPPVA
ncbi:MAG: PAS domain-containing sensor histidine kinase, partial [Bacteroidales bacterium]|nr:PAS domain-containing sensor histidine kinase [Bacteroidales bacterium]